MRGYISTAVLYALCTSSTTAGTCKAELNHQALEHSTSDYIASHKFDAAYDIDHLVVPLATVCSGGENPTIGGASAQLNSSLPCIRHHIDTIDVQIAYLLAHRSDFALMAGYIKNAEHLPLDAPARDLQVANQYAESVGYFGSSDKLGRDIGKSVVAANLALEDEVINGPKCVDS